MDDSFETLDELRNINEGLTSIYDSMNMKLTKYASNSKEFMSTIPDEKKVPVKEIDPFLADETNKEGRPLPSAKIHGMRIDFDADLVKYKVKESLSQTGEFG